MYTQNELIQAAASDEYKLWLHMRRLSTGYIQLTNAKQFSEAKAGLAEMRTASVDLEKEIRTILYRYGCRTELITNVGHAARINAARSPFAIPALDVHCMNMHQFFLRYVNGSTVDKKTQSLTAFYHLVKDVAELAADAKFEHYYGGNQIG